jgi:hypothetical protein
MATLETSRPVFFADWRDEITRSRLIAKTGLSSNFLRIIQAIYETCVVERLDLLPQYDSFLCISITPLLRPQIRTNRRPQRHLFSAVAPGQLTSTTYLLPARPPPFLIMAEPLTPFRHGRLALGESSLRVFRSFSRNKWASCKGGAPRICLHFALVSAARSGRSIGSSRAGSVQQGRFLRDAPGHVRFLSRLPAFLRGQSASDRKTPAPAAAPGPLPWLPWANPWSRSP